MLGLQISRWFESFTCTYIYLVRISKCTPFFGVIKIGSRLKRGQLDQQRMINDYDEPFHDPTNDIIASIFVFSIWVIGFCGFCVLPHALFGYLISMSLDGSNVRWEALPPSRNQKIFAVQKASASIWKFFAVKNPSSPEHDTPPK